MRVLNCERDYKIWEFITCLFICDFGGEALVHTLQYPLEACTNTFPCWCPGYRHIWVHLDGFSFVENGPVWID